MIPATLILIIVFCLIALPILAELRRNRRFQALVKRRHLDYLKWELLDFPTNLLDNLPSWEKAHNVYVGHDGSDLLMTFQIESGWGRQAYGRTIVARRFEKTPEGKPDLSHELIYLSNDRWRVVTRRRRWPGGATLSADEIDQVWNLLAPAPNNPAAPIHLGTPTMYH